LGYSRITLQDSVRLCGSIITYEAGNPGRVKTFKPTSHLGKIPAMQLHSLPFLKGISYEIPHLDRENNKSSRRFSSFLSLYSLLPVPTWVESNTMNEGTHQKLDIYSYVRGDYKFSKLWRKIGKSKEVI